MSNPETVQPSTAQIPSMTATTPVFIHDKDKDRNQDVFWEVGSDHEGSIPTPEENIEDNDTFIDDNEPEIDPPKEDVQEEVDSTQEEDIETDPDEEERKRKRANKNPAQKRISELTRRAKEAEARAYQAESEKAAMEQRLIIKEKEAFDSSEKHLTANKDAVLKHLKEAYEDGDSDKIAKATDLMTQYNARLLMMSDEKERQRTQSQKNSQQQSHPQNQTQPLNDLDEDSLRNGIEWLKTNPWANPSHPKFNPSMQIVGNEYSMQLANQYSEEGRDYDIGSAEFYDDITQYVNKEFRITSNESSNDKPATKERMTMKSNTSAPVASVNRSSNTSPVAKSYKDLQLTPEQKEMAHAMAGTIRDNNRNIITDKKTLEEIYKRNLVAQKGQ